MYARFSKVNILTISSRKHSYLDQGTLEGWLSFNDIKPQELEVKIEIIVLYASFS